MNAGCTAQLIFERGFTPALSLFSTSLSFRNRQDPAGECVPSCKKVINKIKIYIYVFHGDGSEQCLPVWNNHGSGYGHSVFKSDLDGTCNFQEANTPMGCLNKSSVPSQ